MSRVGFLGAGHIAAPMARALARAGHEVTVSRRSEAVSAALSQSGLGIAVAETAEVVERSDILLLCLRPAVWKDVVAGLPFRADQKIVSVMAGVPMAEIAAACAPVRDVSVTIPYGFIENGGCPLPVVGDPGVVQALFGARNPVLPQADEAALNHHFAASTMVAAALGLLEEGAGWLAGKTGSPEAAEIYVSNLVTGVLNGLSRDRAGELHDEKMALATPNTLNLQMVEGLAVRGAFDGLPAILDGISDSMEDDA
jgi:pyrroline-5-carboxylate reductase